MLDWGYLRRQISEWALSALLSIFGLFVVANLLFAAKMAMGIDLFPGHAGSFFAAGRGMVDSMNG